MSNKINKNLIINEVNEISDFDTEKVVVVTSTGELKQVDKSKVGIAEDKVTQIVSQKQEFIKNGAGWSLKYKVDNPTFYEVTGENAIDLTKAYSDSKKKFGAKGKDSFAVGGYNLAGGMSSISMGYATETYGNISIAIGYLKKSYSAYSTLVGGSQNEIGTETEITTPVSSLNTRASIFGGQYNKILNSKWGSIVGGNKNSIIKGDYSAIINSTLSVIESDYIYNTINGGNNNNIKNAEASYIIGGQNNSIIGNSSQVGTNITILGGQNNIGKGSFSLVSGYKNTSVTQGETIVGFGATVQNESLLPTTYYDNSRMFAVGIGIPNSNDTITRRDGFAVYQNGLVIAPTITNSLINTSAKALTTNEWVKYQLDNYDYPIYRDLSSGGYATNQRKLAPDSFGKLGARALDFSFTTPLLIGNYGATGDYSFAHGLDLKSSGYSCVTFGRKNVNNGDFNVVNGEENTLTGSKQIVIGYKNQAKLIGGLVIGSNNNVMGQEALIVGRGIVKEVVDTESVIGWYNKDFTGDETERVFTIANGTSNEERSNALVVYKNGLIVAPSSTNQLINDDLTNKSLITKEYLNPATLINILTSATTDQKNQIKTLLGI